MEVAVFDMKLSHKVATTFSWSPSDGQLALKWGGGGGYTRASNRSFAAHTHSNRVCFVLQFTPLLLLLLLWKTPAHTHIFRLEAGPSRWWCLVSCTCDLESDPALFFIPRHLLLLSSSFHIPVVCGLCGSFACSRSRVCESTFLDHSSKRKCCPLAFCVIWKDVVWIVENLKKFEERFRLIDTNFPQHTVYFSGTSPVVLSHQSTNLFFLHTLSWFGSRLLCLPAHQKFSIMGNEEEVMKIGRRLDKICTQKEVSTKDDSIELTLPITKPSLSEEIIVHDVLGTWEV